MLTNCMFLGIGGGRRLIRCKMSGKSEENSLRRYAEYLIEPFIAVVRNSNTVPSENLTRPNGFKK